MVPRWYLVGIGVAAVVDAVEGEAAVEEPGQPADDDRGRRDHQDPDNLLSKSNKACGTDFPSAK